VCRSRERKSKRARECGDVNESARYRDVERDQRLEAII
jgi:hypothetical protein